MVPFARDDPLLDIAMELENVATHDPYFVQRGLYPNVDFYSGIVLRALGVGRFTASPLLYMRAAGLLPHGKNLVLAQHGQRNASKQKGRHCSLRCPGALGPVHGALCSCADNRVGGPMEGNGGGAAEDA